jgi:hypothetical protein
MFCEHGSSANKDTCILTEPLETVKHWAVCDPLCSFSTCPTIKKIVAEHFMEDYGIDFDAVGTYIERFMVPLCFACPESYECHGYGVNETSASEAATATEWLDEADDDDYDYGKQYTKDVLPSSDEVVPVSGRSMDKTKSDRDVPDAVSAKAQPGSYISDGYASGDSFLPPSPPLPSSPALAAAEAEVRSDQISELGSLETAAEMAEDMGPMTDNQFQSLLTCVKEHECDAETSECALMSAADGTKVAICQCKDAFTPNPADPTSCMAAKTSADDSWAFEMKQVAKRKPGAWTTPGAIAYAIAAAVACTSLIAVSVVLLQRVGTTSSKTSSKSADVALIPMAASNVL